MVFVRVHAHPQCLGGVSVGTCEVPVLGAQGAVFVGRQGSCLWVWLW